MQLLEPYWASNMLERKKPTLQATAGDKEKEGGKENNSKVKMKTQNQNTIGKAKRCVRPMRLAGGYYENQVVNLSGGSVRKWTMHEEKTQARTGHCLLICKAISALSCTVSKKPCSGKGGPPGRWKKKPFVF